MSRRRPSANDDSLSQVKALENGLPTIPFMASGFRQLIFGERSLTKVAGIYSTSESAADAQARLLARNSWDSAQVKLLGPSDGKISRRDLLARKIETDSSGIWRTILRAHAVTGTVGLILGVGSWYLTWRTGSRLVASSGVLSFVTYAFFGMVFGLMAGGLIALRPDHARLITSIRTALRTGNWVTVAHPRTEAQAEEAMKELRDGSSQVERTL